MKKFILSIAMLFMFATMFAQFEVRIIPILDTRVEFGLLNRADIFSFPTEPTALEYDDTKTEYSITKSAEGNTFNPGIYLGLGFTCDLSNDYISSEIMTKVYGFKRSSTLYGEKWTNIEPNNKEECSSISDDFCLGFYEDLMLKFHLLDNQLEASIGFTAGFAVNLDERYGIEWEFGVYPQAKVGYKMDRLYISGTLGFSAFSDLFADFNVFKYTSDNIKYNTIIFSIGVGYLID